MKNAWVIEVSASCFGDCSEFYIWYEDENGKDCLYTQNGKIVSFCNEKRAKQKIVETGLEYAGTNVYDAERLWYWLRTHHKNMEECDFLLDFWNLFTDIAYSVGLEFEPVRTKRSKRCYNKLFFGCDLPAITPEGCEYEPIFTRKERKFIRELMEYGLDMPEKNSAEEGE